MKNYLFTRASRLGLYFFLVYVAITAAWYFIAGRFKEEASLAATELLVTAAWFSLLFTFLMLIWFKRTQLRVPLKQLSQKQLEQQLAAIGFEPAKASGQDKVQVYKPAPPRASAMAGKLFIRKSANFYHLEGPARYLRNLKI